MRPHSLRFELRSDHRSRPVRSLSFAVAPSARLGPTSRGRQLCASRGSGLITRTIRYRRGRWPRGTLWGTCRNGLLRACGPSGGRTRYRSGCALCSCVCPLPGSASRSTVTRGVSDGFAAPASFRDAGRHPFGRKGFADPARVMSPIHFQAGYRAAISREGSRHPSALGKPLSKARAPVRSPTSPTVI